MLPFCAASMLVVACAWLVPGAAVPLISLSIETNENAIWYQTKAGQRRTECQPEQAQCLRSSSSLAWPQIYRSSLDQWGARAFCSPKPTFCCLAQTLDHHQLFLFDNRKSTLRFCVVHLKT